MAHKAAVLSNHPIYSVFQLCLGTWYLANDWLAQHIWGISLWAVCSWSLNFLRKRAARLTATYSQTNARCEQLQSMKGPQCAWSIRRDRGHGYACWKHSLAAATVHFWQGAGTWVSAGMFIHVFCEILRIGGSLAIFVKAWLTCLWDSAKAFRAILSKQY